MCGTFVTLFLPLNLVFFYVNYVNKILFANFYYSIVICQFNLSTFLFSKINNNHLLLITSVITGYNAELLFHVSVLFGMSFGYVISHLVCHAFFALAVTTKFISKFLRSSKL